MKLKKEMHNLLIRNMLDSWENLLSILEGKEIRLLRSHSCLVVLVLGLLPRIRMALKARIASLGLTVIDI